MKDLLKLLVIIIVFALVCVGLADSFKKQAECEEKGGTFVRTEWDRFCLAPGYTIPLK